jgi:tRNA-specific 2-thiouridylase
MFSVAKRVMEAEGASFLVSGEVLGQRPMSQNKEAMQTVLNESNCNGLLLRPLSAKALEPTIAEINGWVDREKLEAIVGRSRDRQLELVKEIGLENFESPGGGCLLTDENFAKKMFDFIKYDTFEVKDIPLMKFGRHLRLSDGAKLVVGRNQEENKHLQNINSDKYYHVKAIGLPGPHSMLSKSATTADKELAAKIILTYCKSEKDASYTLTYDKEELQATAFASRDEIKPYTIM